MAGIKKILHATDFSKASARALQEAIKLAKENHAQLLVVHVIEPTPYVAGGEFGGAEIYTKLEDMAKRNAQSSMSKLMERLKKLKVNAESLLLRGSSHEQIVKAAKSKKADMIVIGTHRLVETFHGQRRRQSCFAGGVPGHDRPRKIIFRMSGPYSLHDFIQDLDRITRTESSQEGIVAAAQPLLAKLVQQPDCIDAKHRKRGATAYGRYMLHRAPLFNISSVVWGPGDNAKAHN
ncbi:MAG: universal stress protein, partial [Candidatus Binatia bacterium]